MLIRLIYASRMASGVDSRHVRDILAASQRNNRSRGVTGVLLFNSGYFLQWLEGGRGAVNERFRAIGGDGRHREAEILCYEAVPNRAFSGWTMGYAGEAGMNAELLFRYTEDTVFDPFTLTAEAAVALVRELAGTSLTMTPA